jgi:hypothetical protein
MNSNVGLLLINCIAGAVATAAVISVHRTSRNYRKLVEQIKRDIYELDNEINKYLDD